MHPITTKALDQLLEDLEEERIRQRIELANETEPGPQRTILARLAALREDELHLNTFIEENR